MKATFFVCAALKDQAIILEAIESLTKQDAISNFQLKYNMIPNDILGPFFKKRDNSKRKLRNIKFSNIYYKSIYNGWNVSVNELSDPANYCMITYLSKIDDTKFNPESESEIIPIYKVKSKI